MTWFSENDDETVKYNFDLWSYNGKFNFKGNKKQLIIENNLKENANFTNNAVESFNHCINKYLNFAKNNNNIIWLVSDILRELINLGYGKNGKIIKVNDLEKLRNINIKSSEIYKLTFSSLKSNDSEEDKIEAELDSE